MYNILIMNRSPSDHSMNILELPLHVVTQELGVDGLKERLDSEISQKGWLDTEKHLIAQSMDLAIIIHQDSMRGDMPYATHLLRVANRICSRNHFNIDDPEIVIAALLHDSVEDNPAAYNNLIRNTHNRHEKEHALYCLSQLFSPRVAELIDSVTNPDFPSGISKNEKNFLYQEHVRHTLNASQSAGVIKMSDFIDNCVGLGYNECSDRAKRLAIKYLPLIPDFINFTENSTLLPLQAKYTVLNQLSKAQSKCEELSLNK